MLRPIYKICAKYNVHLVIYVIFATVFVCAILSLFTVRAEQETECK
jgi:hypothetical protein